MPDAANVGIGQQLLVTERFYVEQAWRDRPGFEPQTRAVIRHPGAVVIIPMVSQDDVCLIRNFRIAIGRSLLELPAGTLTAGEDPMRAAERELAEETGYRGGTWRRLQSFWVSPGILDERMHLFLASSLEPGTPAREPDEDIENVVLPWQEAMSLVRQGAIEDAKTLIGLMLGEQYRDA